METISKNIELDKTNIESIIKQMMGGFANGNADEFATSFKEDADCIIRDGNYFRGRTAIREAHKAIFNSIYNEGTSSTYVMEDIRFLAEDVALVRIKGHMEFTVKGQTQEVNGRINLVFQKAEAVWLIASFQNTSVSIPLADR